VIARAGSRVGTTTYSWHRAPDGGATFALSGGGWAYTSNSEVSSGGGGASSVSFDAAGNITGARRILGSTSSNCAGGATPWGTWLSCEEIDRGYVHECNVLSNAPVRRPALGRFKHEAAAVDGARRVVYLTEDETNGCLYRFRYANAGDLSSGTLEVATGTGSTGGAVGWAAVPDPSGAGTRTRNQVAAARHFNGGEGIWYGSDVVHFATKGDNRVWRCDVVSQQLSVVYDDNTSCNPVLTGVDNVLVGRAGDVFLRKATIRMPAATTEKIADSHNIVGSSLLSANSAESKNARTIPAKTLAVPTAIPVGRSLTARYRPVMPVTAFRTSGWATDATIWPASSQA
jgi:hypothetical protein